MRKYLYPVTLSNRNAARLGSCGTRVWSVKYMTFLENKLRRKTFQNINGAFLNFILQMLQLALLSFLSLRNEAPPRIISSSLPCSCCCSCEAREFASLFWNVKTVRERHGSIDKRNRSPQRNKIQTDRTIWIWFPTCQPYEWVLRMILSCDLCQQMGFAEPQCNCRCWFIFIGWSDQKLHNSY